MISNELRDLRLYEEQGNKTSGIQGIPRSIALAYEAGFGNTLISKDLLANASEVVYRSLEGLAQI